MTVGAPRMIGQPLFSILLCFRPFEGLHPTHGLFNLGHTKCQRALCVLRASDGPYQVSKGSVCSGSLRWAIPSVKGLRVFWESQLGHTKCQRAPCVLGVSVGPYQVSKGSVCSGSLSWAIPSVKGLRVFWESQLGHTKCQRAPCVLGVSVGPYQVSKGSVCSGSLSWAIPSVKGLRVFWESQLDTTKREKSPFVLGASGLMLALLQFKIPRFFLFCLAFWTVLSSVSLSPSLNPFTCDYYWNLFQGIRSPTLCLKALKSLSQSIPPPCKRVYSPGHQDIEAQCLTSRPMHIPCVKSVVFSLPCLMPGIIRSVLELVGQVK